MVTISRSFAADRRRVAGVYLERVSANGASQTRSREHIPKFDDGAFDLPVELSGAARELEVLHQLCTVAWRVEFDDVVPGRELGLGLPE